MPSLSFVSPTARCDEYSIGVIVSVKNCQFKILVCVALIVGISFGEVSAQPPPPNLTAKKIAYFDLGEVRQRLPAQPKQATISNRKNQRKLFERLGDLQREAALDEIVERYAHQPQAESFILDAWGSAISGWMNVDPEGASSALLQLARGTVDLTDAANSRASVRWKDFEIVTAGDFGFIPIQQIFSRGIRAATEVDSELGMRLLSNSDLLGDKVYRLLNDYTESLGQDTDWLQLEQELNRLLDERGRPDYGDTYDVVTSAISHGWARWDLDAALQWLIGRTDNDRIKKQNQALSVLWYLEADPSVVIDWLEENRRPESIVDANPVLRLQFEQQIIDVTNAVGGSNFIHDHFDAMLAFGQGNVFNLDDFQFVPTSRIWYRDRPGNILAIDFEMELSTLFVGGDRHRYRVFTGLANVGAVPQPLSRFGPSESMSI